MPARTCAIVLNYREAGKTGACLISLREQGLNTVYVVDNSEDVGHSQRLVAILESIRDQGIDYNIVALNPDRNLGFAAGVNFAIATDLESREPHDQFLLINNDATADPGLLTQLQDSLEEDSRTCIVAPAVVANGSGVEYEIWYNRYLGLLTRKPTFLSFEYVSGCCMLVDKEALQDERLFDPVFFMYCEDAFLCWQLQQQHRVCRVVSEAHVRHEVGASSSKAGLFYEYHTARGHILMALKAYRHPIEIPVMLVCKLASLSLRSLARCVRYRSLVPVWALLLAWYPAGFRLN